MGEISVVGQSIYHWDKRYTFDKNCRKKKPEMELRHNNLDWNAGNVVEQSNGWMQGKLRKM